MVSPINYSMDVANPMQSAVQGLQLGAGLANAQEQQQGQQLKNQELQLKLQQHQQAVEQQKLIQERLSRLMANKNPTAKDYTDMALLLPEKEAKSVRETWETLSKDQQNNELSFSGQVMSAFNSGASDIGVKLLRDRADAERNSGDEKKAGTFETWAKIAELHPETAAKSIGLMVAQIPGGDKVIEGVVKLGAEQRAEAKAPAELSEAQSKAEKAAVESRFAESKAVMDLQKSGWEISKMQNDIKVSNLNANIAAMNAKIAREGNELKKKELQLKVDEMAQKRDDVVREKAATVDSARSSMDNLLNTADRILKTPIGVVGSATGPISSRIPTTSQDVADFEELITTLGSQAFMSQIPAMKGTGALSEKEGEKLQASLQSLSLRQSPEQLLGNVKEAQRLIMKARGTLTKRYGVPESVPDTPAVSASADDIDALVKKYAQ